MYSQPKREREADVTLKVKASLPASLYGEVIEV